MTIEQKLNRLSIILGSEDADVFSEYLDMAKEEILNWLYINSSVPETVTDVPRKYEQVQIQAVINGFNISGAEGQTDHSENGISRHWKYADMLAYVHTHVSPYIGLPGYANSEQE